MERNCFNCSDNDCRQTQIQILCLQRTRPIIKAMKEIGCEQWYGTEIETSFNVTEWLLHAQAK